MKMKINFKSTESVFSFIGILFALIGTVFLIAGIIAFDQSQKFFSRSVQTDAVITQIKTERYRSNGKYRTRHNVWVEYTVDGEQYEQLINYYNSNMCKGDIITIDFDPENPSKIMSRSGSNLVFMIIIPMGGLFLILGLILVFRNVISGSKKKKLIENGERFSGVITNVMINNNLTINNRHPYKAECEVSDPYSGEKIVYRSDNIMDDISYLIGREVNIYVDSSNKNNYYVDINELIKRYSSEEYYRQ